MYENNPYNQYNLNAGAGSTGQNSFYGSNASNGSTGAYGSTGTSGSYGSSTNNANTGTYGSSQYAGGPAYQEQSSATTPKSPKKRS